MTALGFIETKGLIAAIESADAMLKAADVRLLEKTQVGAGLVTITVAGEVAAVKASIDAAAAAVERISGSTLVSQHVIARPDVELEKIIATKEMPVEVVELVSETEETIDDEDADPIDSMTELDLTAEETDAILSSEDLVVTELKEDEETEISELTAEDVVEEDVQPEPEEEVATPVQKELPKASKKEESTRYGASQLKKMNVSKLRVIARSFEGFSIARKEIKVARKKELIEAIMNAYRQEEE